MTGTTGKVVLRRRSTKPTILRLQQEYLETEDPRVLDRLYRDLFNLCLTIGKGWVDVEHAEVASHDLASSVIMRLLEKHEPVIKGAVSSYIRHAFFFMAKPGKAEDDIEDHEDLESVEPGLTCDPFIDRVLRDTGIDTTTEVGGLVEVTLRSRVSWRRVWNRLDKGPFRDEYKRLMQEVHRDVKKKVQGNGVLPVQDGGQ